ncbi:MAG: T9SS type A sorting domain-containing protein [Bacteroidetes bacterium]|nr:T9SS type A sorting domain-containing protein [Bacteroidota bacterium]
MKWHIISVLTVLTLFLFGVSNSLQGQTIPWASQQPTWVFPIYFEDGSGQKDTVYLGYDMSATGSLDPIFGDDCLKVDDTTLFLAVVDAICGYYFKDTIARQASVDGNIAITISFHNSVWPIKMKFDSQLLYSDFLPFYIDSTGYPDSLPKAYGSVDCLHPESGCILGYDAFQIGEDPLNWFPWGPCNFPTQGAPCSTAESLMFYGDTAVSSSDWLEIEIYMYPYGVLPPGGIGIIDLERINIYPNPVYDWINVEHQGHEPIVLELYDITGSLLYQRSESKSLIRINMSHFAPGTDILRTINERAVQVNKVIKQ